MNSSLLKEGITLEVKGPSFVYTSSLNGVRPLLELLDKDINVKGMALKDRVTGKAAVLLYLKLGIGSVQTDLISENALALLEKEKIPVRYQKKIPYILNHKRDDLCPLEKATLPIDSVDDGVVAIKAAIRAMQAKS
jgi:hypothetical protein